jgi:hypothetical protein
MERYFQSEVAYNHMSELHADISVLLHMNIYPDNDERAIEDPDLGRWQDSGVEEVTDNPEQEKPVEDAQEPVEASVPEPQEKRYLRRKWYNRRNNNIYNRKIYCGRYMVDAICILEQDVLGYC